MDLSTNPFFRVDEITVTPAAMVRSLHMVVRHRYAFEDPTAGTDLPRLISSRTPLSFASFNLFFLSRLSLLPTRGRSWYDGSKQCRFCSCSTESTSHVVAGCQSNMVAVRQRHNDIINILRSRIRADYDVTEEPNTDGLFPDLKVRSPDGETAFIEVSCPWDCNMAKAFNTKKTKYAHLEHPTLPLIIGGLGSWLASNEDVRAFIRLSRRCWKTVRIRMRVSNIDHSTKIIRAHLRVVNLCRLVD